MPPLRAVAAMLSSFLFAQEKEKDTLEFHFARRVENKGPNHAAFISRAHIHPTLIRGERGILWNGWAVIKLLAQG